MESVEEVPHTNSAIENVKDVLSSEEIAVDGLTPQVCQKSNGTVEISISEKSVTSETASVADEVIEKICNTDALTKTSTPPEKVVDSPGEQTTAPTDTVGEKHQQTQNLHNENLKNVTVTKTEAPCSLVSEKSDNLVVTSSTTEEQLPKVTSTVVFETEVVVEENGNSQDATSKLSNEQDDTNNLLNDLNQNIEFNEVLCSSNISGNIENNNCEKQEVFNKEELLDILEGNDESPLKLENTTQEQQDEVQIALQQLSRLQTQKKKKIRYSAESSDKKENKRKVVRVVKNVVKLEKGEKTSPVKDDKLKNVATSKRIGKKNQIEVAIPDDKSKEASVDSQGNDKDNIVHKLFKDWDDEEGATEEIDQPAVDTSTNTSKTVPPTEETNKAIEQSVDIKTEDESNTADASANEIQSHEANPSGDESQPQRRLGRVIKKKIIFDPDNPDTFTKGKSASKATAQQETPAKKSKIEAIRPKSKSPVAKLQWKKPTPRGNKQNKRLTEVDKLLMDEGAVNMIYQLTPEASKGKKNVRTKAEFIKKLQSSTPESSEMKFRERKKECKEDEPKKIPGGKPRTSLSSSVKSMSVCEDFETNIAEDSIIYRRHSSSSYSSSCMSPRRMSDVEGNVSTMQNTPKPISESTLVTQNETPVPEKSIEVVISGTPVKTGIIDKEDCLSIKQKLNSKLSLALNKRKRENAKTDKPIKMQKVKEVPSKSKPFDYVGFKYLNVKIDHRLAEIIITHVGKKTVAVLRELERALLYVNGKSEVTVTLLTSVCGVFCPPLNLQPLLDDNIEARTNAAHELAEAVRLVLMAARGHSKLVVGAGAGALRAPGAALLALCDVPLLAHGAALSLCPPQPGAALFAAQLLPAPRGLVCELLALERRLSAGEAVAAGLAARLADAREARALAAQLAMAPPSAVQLKKRLLNVSAGESEPAFLAALEAERDYFVEYWTSVEGQDMIRAQTHAPSHAAPHATHATPHATHAAHAAHATHAAK